MKRIIVFDELWYFKQTYCIRMKRGDVRCTIKMNDDIKNVRLSLLCEKINHKKIVHYVLGFLIYQLYKQKESYKNMLIHIRHSKGVGLLFCLNFSFKCFEI